MIAIQFFHKKNYWKVLSFTSFLFLFFISGEGIMLILYLAILTYYFSLNINRLISFKWWMVVVIMVPLLIKKIFIKESYFDTLVTPFDTTTKLISLVGLSYITFNAIGYLIDIKRKYITPETNFFKLLLYLTYFPIIFSGPLTRAKYFFSQIENISFKRDSIVNGLRLILWGLFKNLVVGARLFVLLTNINELNLKGSYYLLNGFVFFLFLYCTFSSFINIFQGISLIFNIKLNENFKNRVYLSASRDKFWKGWHISLNHWFRDYFFYSIIRFDRKRKYTNLLLFITFIAIALWHDFTIIFLTWGILNAIWLIAERKSKKYINVEGRFSFLGIVYHLVIASLLSTVFISKDVFELFKTLFGFSKYDYPFENLVTLNTFIVILLFIYMDFYERKTTSIRIDEYIEKQSAWHRYFFYYTLCLFILFLSISPKVVNFYNLF
ncbi:MBOAT family O-acyltransferase [Flavobacterium laiguense]|nr:MBOAT family O-acyltransferase [Flavobacterium laiguense]